MGITDWRFWIPVFKGMIKKKQIIDSHFHGSDIIEGNAGFPFSRE